MNHANLWPASAPVLRISRSFAVLRASRSLALAQRCGSLRMTVLFVARFALNPICPIWTKCGLCHIGSSALITVRTCRGLMWHRHFCLCLAEQPHRQRATMAHCATDSNPSTIVQIGLQQTYLGLEMGCFGCSRNVLFLLKLHGYPSEHLFAVTLRVSS